MNATVKAIPEGHHTITPYLVVKNGAQAIEFYKKAFGAEECFRMNGALPLGDTLEAFGVSKGSYR